MVEYRSYIIFPIFPLFHHSKVPMTITHILSFGNEGLADNGKRFLDRSELTPLIYPDQLTGTDRKKGVPHSCRKPLLPTLFRRGIPLVGNGVDLRYA